MNLKDQLIREYQEDAQRRSNERAAQNKRAFDKWIDGEVIKLKNQMRIVFGEEFEYNITYRQNVHGEMGIDWQPYVEIEELRAIFRHNGMSLSMYPDFQITDNSIPHDWHKNPQNKDAPKAKSVSSRGDVGKMLQDWEKADWEIHPWPANGYCFEDAGGFDALDDPEPELKKRFDVLPAYDLNRLYHAGVKFTIHGAGISDEWGEGWFVEFISVEVGEIAQS